MDFCSTVDYHFSGLIGKASHPDMQKIRMIGIFFENWQFKFLLLLFTVCTYVWTFRPRLIWCSRSNNIILYWIRYQVISRQVNFVEFSTNLPEGRAKPIRVIGGPDKWISSVFHFAHFHIIKHIFNYTSQMHTVYSPHIFIVFLLHVSVILGP